MSSEFFMYDNSFFSDPFSQLNDSKSNQFDETLDQINSFVLSSSDSSPYLGNAEYSAFEVKTEECQLNFDGFFSGCGNSFLTHNFDMDHESAMNFIERSYTSNSFENKIQNLSSFWPQFDSVLENQMLSSPEDSFCSGQMRSTGDLQNVITNMQIRNVTCSSPLSTEKSSMEEPNLKVVPYSAEVKRERIDRYKAKRTRRNFNKTIKYVCRKTLADNRSRIRGRFARNDEALEIPKASMFLDGFHGEDNEVIARRESFFNGYGLTQFENNI
ncbi:hypothetical protein ACJIZ3_003942 [Penstemon smallii]|uniref:CCT domain-containing protein n=1 Tax=Penstemon smallii TaxID=265156 RepID=A0ABD3S0Q1_9LAMI